MHDGTARIFGATVKPQKLHLHSTFAQTVVIDQKASSS